MADAALNLHQARRNFTLTGVLQRSCRDNASCIVELIDGDHRLEVIPAGFAIDPTLWLPAQATVHGQLEVDLPSRSWRLRSSAVLLQISS